MRHTLPVPLVVFSIACAMLLAGCGSTLAGGAPSSSPTLVLSTPTDSAAVTDPAQIVGVWQVYDPQCTPGYMLIRPDGTYTWSCRPDGSNGLSGKYHFSHDKFVVLNDLCGAEGQYHVKVAGDSPKALAFSVVKDSCDAEIKTLTGQKVTWVSSLP